MHLLKAVHTVAFKDAQPFRQSVFEYLSGHKRSVRLARAVHKMLGKTWLSTLLVSVYGLRAAVCVRAPVAPILGVARYKNERRQFEHLAPCLPLRLEVVELGSDLMMSPSNWWAAAAIFACPRRLALAWRLLHRYNTRSGDFLVACRVASTIGYFLRFDREFSAKSGESERRVVLVSSDSNPYAMGAAWAARRHGLKTVYVTHGHIPDGPPYLDFDLSIVDGPAVLDVYDSSRGRRGQVVFKGAEGDFRPLTTQPLRAERGITLGVFMSLIVDWASFAPLLARLKAHLQPETIILRLHPNEVIRDPKALEHVDLEGVEVSYGDTVLTEDAARCDLVIAGNSSCHLTLLRFGVPTAYVPGLDIVPHDFYRFLKRRVVPEFTTPEAIEPSAVADFFEEQGWAARFRAFDAGYDGPALGPDVGRALVALVANETQEAA